MTDTHALLDGLRRLTASLLAVVVFAAAPMAMQSSAPAPAAAAAAAADPGVTLPADYVIGPEDVLSILFWRDTDMTGDVVVRPDGKITLQLIGELAAAGMTPDALRDVVTKAAAKLIEDPTVTIVVKQINSRKVFITGQVTRPAAYPLIGPLTTLQLIALAGGLTEYANGSKISIMRNEGGQTKTFKFNYSDVIKGKRLEQNIALRPGDTVVVP